MLAHTSQALYNHRVSAQYAELTSRGRTPDSIRTIRSRSVGSPAEEAQTGGQGTGPAISPVAGTTRAAWRGCQSRAAARPAVGRHRGRGGRWSAYGGSEASRGSRRFRDALSL